ncbi:type II secretion system protein GspK [Novosphingobium sp. MMS21-SN21R]|uniref:general secretion pathway protein GspK n=1 Tax=Novosphingobium sp. MMS21-SN21R TaxID=2969298 RepID=UPI0028863342|nr:type II secretion system protein GspK [Novosphingobium sp. MMS21-SN21R]MDT0508401.1 type II secretion system protein GspK [Novosphingobium sp. MMS21-SN21R]
MSQLPPGERGYAMVAAVAAIALFASLALVLVTGTRGGVVMAGAERDRAEAGAAADAGLAMALRGLAGSGALGAWPIDGRVRNETFGPAKLAIRIEDERGKLPINLLEETQVQRLLERAGLRSERLAIATDSLNDWLDEDDQLRAFGAERDWYVSRGIVPRNGPLVSVEELSAIRGFDAALVDRLRPIITLHWGGGPFEPRYASLDAIAVMSEDGEDPVAQIERARELAGQVTALSFNVEGGLVGRPLTVTVDATMPDGAHAVRRTLVELTGSSARPYVLRKVD